MCVCVPCSGLLEDVLMYVHHEVTTTCILHHKAHMLLHKHMVMPSVRSSTLSLPHTPHTTLKHSLSHTTHNLHTYSLSHTPNTPLTFSLSHTTHIPHTFSLIHLSHILSLSHTSHTPHLSLKTGVEVDQERMTNGVNCLKYSFL